MRKMASNSYVYNWKGVATLLLLFETLQLLPETLKLYTASSNSESHSLLTVRCFATLCFSEHCNVQEDEISKWAV